MPSPRSASNDETPSQEPITPRFVALVRVYSRVMRHRATPFSVPQEGMDPMIPASGIPQTVDHADPESIAISAGKVFTGLDLEDPKAKASREAFLMVAKTQERMAHGLAIQPEFEPFSTLPVEHRGDRFVRQVKETFTLQPMKSEVTTTKKDTITGRLSPEVFSKTQIRDMRWKTEQLLAGKTVWPAEPLLVMVTTDIETFLPTLDATVFPLTPWRAVHRASDPVRPWSLERLPGPVIPHQAALVELVGLFPPAYFRGRNGVMFLDPKVRKLWQGSDLFEAQRVILDLLERALTPPGGLPQTCWVRGWEF